MHIEKDREEKQILTFVNGQIFADVATTTMKHSRMRGTLSTKDE
jgi:hypothetical protein